MEQRTNSPFTGTDRLVLALVGVVLVIGTVLFMWSDRAHDWRYYQAEFTRMVAEQLGEDRAADVPQGLQQVWVAGLERADRCVTCHQATAWKGFEKAEHPYRTHPEGPLKTHPVAEFGCTSCHGGQGWAIDTYAAHGEVAHWEEPLLSRSLGESYTLSGNKNALMQMNCNTCHRYDRQTAGADAVNLAKRLVNEKGCRACHVINGFGGTIGPDLTEVGEKAPEQYDFSRLSGQRTAFAWHVAHFKDPRALSEGTVMPNFNLTTEQAQALSMLVLSWRRHDVPARYLSGAPRVDPRSAEELAAEEAM
jgi:cytochrome c2